MSFIPRTKQRGGESARLDTDDTVHTGEEGEETVYQCRAKLYVMQSDGGWKERGVGALKLNVRESDGKSPRLGMSSINSLSLLDLKRWMRPIADL